MVFPTPGAAWNQADSDSAKPMMSSSTSASDPSEDLLLPLPKERDWILKIFRQLIQQTDPKHFLSVPFIESNPTFFPDPWRGGRASVIRVLRRLLHYGGIDDLNIRLSVFDPDPEKRDKVVAKPKGPNGQENYAWLIE